MRGVNVLRSTSARHAHGLCERRVCDAMARARLGSVLATASRFRRAVENRHRGRGFRSRRYRRCNPLRTRRTRRHRVGRAVPGICYAACEPCAAARAGVRRPADLARLPLIQDDRCDEPVVRRDGTRFRAAGVKVVRTRRGPLYDDGHLRCRPQRPDRCLHSEACVRRRGLSEREVAQAVRTGHRIRPELPAAPSRRRAGWSRRSRRSAAGCLRRRCDSDACSVRWRAADRVRHRRTRQQPFT